MLDEVEHLAVETMQKGKQAIVFVPSRASAEKNAESISKLTTFNFPEFEKEVLKAASSPTRQCRRLSNCIKKGVAFHHAGLLQKQKDLIEDEFKKGNVKIICATPTLAAGLSLPVFRVIIKSLKRFSGSWGMDWIPVLEYLQMAGRAGRPEYEAYGESIVVAKSSADKEEILERYVQGVPEEIYSKLAVEPVLRMYLLSLIATGIVNDEKSVLEFFDQTFWASQFRDKEKLHLIIDKVLNQLEEWEFIKIIGQDKNDFVVASDLNNKKKLKATMVGRRISELYLDPLTARHFLDCLNNYDDDKNTFSLLQMISNTLEMRPLLRVKKKQEDFIQEELVKNYDALLQEEPSVFDLEYADFMNSIKTTLFFSAWIDEKEEDFLLETYDVRPGEIRVKIEIADWLIYAITELAKIQGLNYDLIKELNKLRIRVKNGAKEELLPLLKLKNIGRVRARKLVNNNLKTIPDLKNTDITSLGQILGKATAESVKKQLDGDVKEVKKGTRKGQLSMEKY